MLRLGDVNERFLSNATRSLTWRCASAGSASRSSKKSCWSIVNLRAFINPSPRHSPLCLPITKNCIESRLADGSVCPRRVTLTTECITARAGPRRCTNFTSPSRRDPFTTVSKICRWNATISRRPCKCVPFPRDEIGTVRERGCKSGAITRVPSVDHPPMDGTDRILVRGSLSCWL